MCTYLTERLPVTGSAKGPNGWFDVEEATVYLDHPAHAPAEHTLNVDFFSFAGPRPKRVALELDPASARALASAILRSLAAGEPAALEVPA